MISCSIKPLMRPIWDECVKLFASTKLLNRLFNREQNNFPRQLVTQIRTSVSICNSKAQTCHLIWILDQASGQFPVFCIQLNNIVKDGASTWIPHFNISLRFLSGPGAFLDFNNLMMTAFVSFSVKGWSRLLFFFFQVF